MKPVIAFIVALIVGAAIMLVVRSVAHDPHANHTAPAAPAASPGATPSAPAADPHAGHAPATVAPEVAAPAADAPAEPRTVNSICPICGMDVDPALGIWHFHGKPIGIGCRACIEPMNTHIERYGPAALENKRVR